MRIARWSAGLLSFNYEIASKPGHQNVTADCLLRLPLTMTERYREPDVEMVALVSGGLDFAAVPVENSRKLAMDALYYSAEDARICLQRMALQFEGH